MAALKAYIAQSGRNDKGNTVENRDRILTFLDKMRSAVIAAEPAPLSHFKAMPDEDISVLQLVWLGDNGKATPFVILADKPARDDGDL